MVDWKFIASKYWNGALKKLSGPESLARKREDGLSIRYFRSAGFPSPEQFNHMGWETFDVALNLTGDVAVDIGAHVGAYALRLARNFRLVYAFEPNPVIFRVLQRNIRENRIRNIKPEEIAISDAPGRRMMHVSPRFLSASTLANRHYDDLQLDQAMFPHCESLDSYLENKTGRVGFVKVDVENHELAVLKGMERTVMKHHPVISVEVHQAPTTLNSCYCNVCQYLRSWRLSVELHGRYTTEMRAHWLIAR